MGLMLILGIYYFWYEWSKSFIENAAIKSTGRRRPLTTAESMLAGLIAGSATVIFTNPIWVVNTRETAKKDIDDKDHHLKESSCYRSCQASCSTRNWICQDFDGYC